MIVEAKIPGTTPMMQVKLRFNKEIEDYVVHHKNIEKGLQSIGSCDYSITRFTPPFGKFVLLRYITKSFPLQLPFSLKATYNVNKVYYCYR